MFFDVPWNVCPNGRLKLECGTSCIVCDWGGGEDIVGGDEGLKLLGVGVKGKLLVGGDEIYTSMHS